MLGEHQMGKLTTVVGHLLQYPTDRTTRGLGCPCWYTLKSPGETWQTLEIGEDWPLLPPFKMASTLVVLILFAYR